jgi:hypothetical protein
VNVDTAYLLGVATPLFVGLVTALRSLRRAKWDELRWQKRDDQ